MQAVSTVGHRPWPAHWAHIAWKRLLFGVGLSLVLSTRLLFQQGLFEDFPLAEILESLTLYFLDILVIATLMVCAVSYVDMRRPAAGTARNAALSAAVILSVLVGVAIQMVAHYGAGPYPPEGYVLGEAARSAMLGGAIALIYETTRRHHTHRRQLHETELRFRILENQMIEARITMMEAQIEPHFLFNTLATIMRLYRTEPVAGARMVSRLSEYLKAALPQIRHGMPTLASEIDLVRAYLEILKIRMGPRLAFTIDAPPRALSIPFPAMVMLTLVENAIKHGLYHLPEGGRIDVHVVDSSDTLVLEVRDNGVGFQAGAGTSGSGIGLSNIRARLDALYGQAARLVLVQGQPSGVIARVEIANMAARKVAGTMSDKAFSTGASDQPTTA
jgi:signal transduction histidine kinase